MKGVLPKTAIGVIVALRQAGYEAFAVGGSVRDLLLTRESYDWDFTTNATPEQIQEVFPESYYENSFGTVGLTNEHLAKQFGDASVNEADQFGANSALETSVSPLGAHTNIIEITTYRAEGNYEDFRRPSEVSWGKTLEEDLKRRDFTMNALALSLSAQTLETYSLSNYAQWPDKIDTEFDIIDPFGGRVDLRNNLLRSVGPASERFQEDALRMLRAVRLGAQLQLRIDQEIVIALQQKADLIQHVSWERIRDEIMRILVTDHIESAFQLLNTTGILVHILPELVAMRGVDQRGHHEYDVWTHSLRASQACSSDDPVVKFAALLHDVAKPLTQAPLPNSPGEYSFHNHEVVGARVARDIAKRFCLSKDDIQRVFTLVRWHMFHYQSDMTDAAIRRFIRRVGRENILDMISLREGDRIGSGSKRTSWRLEEMKNRIHEQLHQPMQINEMAVDGHDVMEILQVKPGPIIGQILNQLFEQVLDDPSVNTREHLLPQIEALRGKSLQVPALQAEAEV